MSDLNHLEELEQAIGKLTIAWTGAHDFVFRIFHAISGLTEAQARAVFFSIRSDRGQREITERIVMATLDSENDKEAILEFVGAMKTLGNLADKRNQTIHSTWAINVFTNREGSVTHKMVKQPTLKTFERAIESIFDLESLDYASEFREAAIDINKAGSELVTWYIKRALPFAEARNRKMRAPPSSD